MLKSNQENDAQYWKATERIDNGEEQTASENARLEDKYDKEVADMAYDEPVQKEEIVSLKRDIENALEQKAHEIGATTEEISNAAQLDLKSLDEAELNRGELEFIKDNIFKSVNNIWQSKITGNKYLPSEFFIKTESRDPLSYLNRMLEFAGKHKKISGLLQLAIYVSAWGPAVFKDLAADNKALNIGDRQISLAEVASNPELMEKIDRERSMVTPLDISHLYAHGKFQDQDEPSDLEDVSRISVVALEDFKFKDAGVVVDAVSKQDEVMNKYKDEQGNISEENLQKAKQELDVWSQSNGYDTFITAYNIENEFQNLKFDEIEVANSKNFNEFKDAFLKALEKHYTLEEVKTIGEKNPEQVMIIIAETLREETDYDFNYALSKMIMEAIGDIPGPIGKYAQEKWNESSEERYREGVPYSSLDRGKVICTESSIVYVAAKVALEQAGVPKLNKVACLSTSSRDRIHAWSMMATLSPDGKKIICTSGDTTLFEKQFFEIGKKEEDEEFNAVDSWHYYEAVDEDYKYYVDITDVDAAGYHIANDSTARIDTSEKNKHNMTLEAIKKYNTLVFQEKLKANLTMYDYQARGKDSNVGINGKAYEKTSLRDDKAAIAEINMAKETEDRTLLAKIRGKILGGK